MFILVAERDCFLTNQAQIDRLVKLGEELFDFTKLIKWCLVAGMQFGFHFCSR